MDPTVTRLDEDRFLVLAPTLAQRRTGDAAAAGLPSGAVVTDVTSGYATLHIAGPRSRDLLARLTDDDMSNEAFPFLSAREIEVGWAQALAFRVSFTGELGWELSVPTEFAGRSVRPSSWRPARTSGSVTQVRSRSMRCVSSGGSARGGTTWAPSTIRSPPGWASRCRRQGRRLHRA